MEEAQQIEEGTWVRVKGRPGVGRVMPRDNEELPPGVVLVCFQHEARFFSSGEIVGWLLMNPASVLTQHFTAEAFMMDELIVIAKGSLNGLARQGGAYQHRKDQP